MEDRYCTFLSIVGHRLTQPNLLLGKQNDKELWLTWVRIASTVFDPSGRLRQLLQCPPGVALGWCRLGRGTFPSGVTQVWPLKGIFFLFASLLKSSNDIPTKWIPTEILGQNKSKKDGDKKLWLLKDRTAFKKQGFLPTPVAHLKKIGVKWKIWILFFHLYPMSLCRSSGLDTKTLQTEAFFPKKKTICWKFTILTSAESLFLAHFFKIISLEDKWFFYETNCKLGQVKYSKKFITPSQNEVYI